MVIWHATQQPAGYATEQQMGRLAARWTRLFRRTGRTHASVQVDRPRTEKE